MFYLPEIRTSLSVCLPRPILISVSPVTVDVPSYTTLAVTRLTITHSLLRPWPHLSKKRMLLGSAIDNEVVVFFSFSHATVVNLGMRLLASAVTTSFPPFTPMVPVACMSVSESDRAALFSSRRRYEEGFGPKRRHSAPAPDTPPTYGRERGIILLKTGAGVSLPSVESFQSLSSRRLHRARRS
jgi:hypothetical protein